MTHNSVSFTNIDFLLKGVNSKKGRVRGKKEKRESGKGRDKQIAKYQDILI